MPPFRALCFSTRLLIEMTKAITMTLLAKRPSLDLRLAPVKDVQQTVSATLEFKMVPETFRVSRKQLARLRWANTHSQTLLSARTAPLVLFVLLSHINHILHAQHEHTNGSGKEKQLEWILCYFNQVRLPYLSFILFITQRGILVNRMLL